MKKDYELDVYEMIRLRFDSKCRLLEVDRICISNARLIHWDLKRRERIEDFGKREWRQVGSERKNREEVGLNISKIIEYKRTQIRHRCGLFKCKTLDISRSLFESFMRQR